MALSIPTIAIPDLIQNQAYSFEMSEAMGAAVILHAMPEVPLGMTFTALTRLLEGSPTQRQFNNEYHYVAVAGSEVVVENVYVNVLGINENPRMHQTKFFKYPMNYLDFDRNLDSNGDAVFEIADNDYNTFSQLDEYTINITDDGTATGVATEFTHVFIKCTGVTEVSINSESITIPSTVVNYAGRDVRIDPDGYQNFLHQSYDYVGAKPTAKTIELAFTGSNIKIYEVMILDEVLYLDSNRSFTEISYRMADRSSILQKDLAERITKVPGINQDRWKWDINYQQLFLPEQINPTDLDEDIYNKVLNFIRNRTLSDNFVFCGKYSDYPQRIYPATFPNPEMQMAFLSRFTGSGESIDFTVMEL